MVVGDELQSIYSFRHADLDVFRRRREQIDADPGAELMRLSGNFRSRPEVIGAVNLFGEALLGAAYRPLRVGAPPSSPAPRGTRRRRSSSTSPRATVGTGRDRARTGDRRAHAAELPGRGAGAGGAPARAPRRGGRARRDGRPAPRLHPPRRLRGLARARRPAALRGRRARLLVPAAGGGRLRAAGDDREPAGRRSALRRPRLARLRGRPGHALAAPRRGRAAAPRLAGAGGAGGGRPAEAATEGLAAPERLDEIPAGERELLAEFAARLADLRARAPRLSLAGLIEAAVTETGYDLATLLRREGEARLANVRKLSRLAAAFEEREGRDLRGLLDFLAARAESDTEAQAATAAEGHDGVRIMTVHNAKGLEFEVVAVPDLARGLLSGGRRPSSPWDVSSRRG